MLRAETFSVAEFWLRKTRLKFSVIDVESCKLGLKAVVEVNKSAIGIDSFLPKPTPIAFVSENANESNTCFCVSKDARSFTE